MVGIGNAQFGFDQSGLQKLKNDINIRCIDSTILVMQQQLAILNANIDTVWKGKSAQTFKNRLQADKDKVEVMLKQTRDTCIRVLDDAGRKYVEADEGMKF